MQLKGFYGKIIEFPLKTFVKNHRRKWTKWQFGLKSMDSDSAESLLDSVEKRIPPNPLDSAESESESKDSVVHYQFKIRIKTMSKLI